MALVSAYACLFSLLNPNMPFTKVHMEVLFQLFPGIVSCFTQGKKTLMLTSCCLQVNVLYTKDYDEVLSGLSGFEAAVVFTGTNHYTLLLKKDGVTKEYSPEGFSDKLVPVDRRRDRDS